MLRQVLPGPPFHTTRKTPTLDERQTTCTHTTVTRLYDNYGSHRCQICRRHPNIGWVYRCTQDHDGFLPESDFTTTTTKAAPVIVSKGRHVWRLKQWMYEAVTKGQYTVEQFSTLFHQRQGVKKAIFPQSQGTVTASTSASSHSSNTASELANTTLASIASSYVDDGSDLSPDESGVPSKVKHYQSPVGEQLLNECDITAITGETTQPNLAYPACSWTCCQTCRPTYRDRAWQSLTAIANGPTRIPPSWELENLRVSDARIVANIGLPKPGIPFQVDDIRYDSSSEAPLSTKSNLGELETDTFTCGVLSGSRTKGGFRATVRRTIKEAIGHARASSSEIETSSNNSSQSSFKGLGRSMLFGPRSCSQPNIAYSPRLIQDGQLQESLILMIASNTPLPDAAMDFEVQHDGEVEVDGGVAVTEEGIVMSAADIIMQV